MSKFSNFDNNFNSGGVSNITPENRFDVLNSSFSDVNTHDTPISNLVNENIGHVNHDLQALNISANNYNRFQIPLLNSWTKLSFGHIFITLPSLNLFKNPNGDNAESGEPGSIKIDFNTITDVTPYLNAEALANEPELYNRLKDNPALYRYLDSTVDGTPFIVPFYNHAKRVSPTNASMKTSSSAKNAKGVSVDYVEDMIESMNNGTISITFHDNDNMDVFNLLDFLAKYSEGVRLGKIYPRFKNIKDEKLDYSMSIFVFLLGDDAQTIKFQAKWTGVVLTEVPYSTYQYEKRGDSQPEHTVTFKFVKYEPMNPIVLNEFNQLTTQDRSVPTNRLLGNWEDFHKRDYAWYYPTDVCVIKDYVKKWDNQHSGNSFTYKLMFYNRTNDHDTVNSKVNEASNYLLDVGDGHTGTISLPSIDRTKNYFSYQSVGSSSTPILGGK